MSGRRPGSVAVYVHGLGAGGAERTAATLAAGFRAAGLATTLVVDDPHGENRAGLDPGLPLVDLSREARGHIGTVRALARWLARARPDIALAIDAAADVKLVAAWMTARAAPGPRLPTRIVLSYHGHAGIVRGRLGRAAYPLAPLLARAGSATVCVSDGLARHLVQDWRAPAARVATIPNPIPVERAHPPADAAALARRPPEILAVGRLVAEKGHAGLIAALGDLPPDTRLTILGEGPERARLEALAARAGGRVRLPGYGDPWDAYARARVFALNSSSEAFGNVVVEALASGLPVVASDCGGPGEILAGGRHGRLVPVGDARALAAALRAALAEPGDPGPRVARAAEYGTERVVEAYRALFADVLDGGEPRRARP